MSKKKVKPKYFDAPSPEEMAAMERKLEQIKRANRKPRTLKIEPVVATVAACLQEGKSSRNTVRIVQMHTKPKLSKETVLRFAKVYNSNLGPDAPIDQT